MSHPASVPILSTKHLGKTETNLEQDSTIIREERKLVSDSRDSPSKLATQAAVTLHRESQMPARQVYSESLSGSLWTLWTNKPWKMVCEDIPRHAEEQKFCVVGQHDLRDTFAKKSVHYFEDEAMIFELCNAHIASAILSQHLGLSAVLPCRLSVCEKIGRAGSTIHLFLPTTLLHSCFESEMSESDKKEYKELADNTTNTLKEIARRAATNACDEHNCRCSSVHLQSLEGTTE